MIKILLIDHAAQHAQSISALLSGPTTSELQVHSVSSYREILNGFLSNAYDVCLIDSLMNNGLELFAQSRSLSFSAPVVLVIPNSANTAVQAMRDGVADCLLRDELSVLQIERSVCYAVERARNSMVQNQRERRHLALLENASEIVYTHDLKGDFTSVNRAGERLLGFSEAEFLAMNVGQIVMPEYRGLQQKMIEHALDAQAQVVEKIELATKDGGKLAVEINSHPIQRKGRSIEIQSIARLTKFNNHFKPRDLGTEGRQSPLRDAHVMHSVPDLSGSISYPFFAQ
jgi:PAS domain S-box-containing protein